MSDTPRAKKQPVEITPELIQELPKTELHCHLDGSLRPETLIELAAKRGVALPADEPEALKRKMGFGAIHEDLVEYLKAFDTTTAVMQHRDDIHRVAYELAEDNAKENVLYMEQRYCPTLSSRAGLRIDEVMDAWRAGIRDAEHDFGIMSKMIVCGLRNLPNHESMQLAALTVLYKGRGCVAFDLAGAERDFPAKKHRDAFYFVANANMAITAHAGEAFGPESIEQAIHVVHADRVGHGTHLAENPDLMLYLADRRVPVEACLSSNVQTQAVESFEKHPFRTFLDNQVRVTLNTDNRLITDTTLNKEIAIAVETYDLTVDELATVILNGFRSAFLHLADRKEFLRKARKRIATLVDRPMTMDSFW